MKSHNEMYQSLLSRYNEYQEKKAKRISAVRRIVPVLACLCVVAVLGLGYWNHMDKIPIIPNTVNEDITSSTETTTATVTESTSVSKPVSTTTEARTQRDTSITSAVTEHNTQNNTTAAANTVSKVTTDAWLITATSQTTMIYTAVNTTTTKLDGFNMGGGNDLGITHTTTTGGDNGFVHTTIQTTTTEAVATTTITTTTAPPLPINEDYSVGIMDGYDGWYINAFKIPSDYVDEYIGIIVMRGKSGPFLDAKAYSIKNSSNDIAIAIKFEGYDEYYLYRNNKTAISTIKELFPEEGANLIERTFFYE